MLGVLERVLEERAVDTENDAAIHRDESAIRVVGEAFVVGDSGETLDALVVEAEVEDGVHHSGHRELGPRTHAHEQRILRVAEFALHRLLELGHLRLDLGVETLRPPAVHVGATRVGGDREAGRNRKLEDTRHLGEIGALATEQIFHLHGRTTVFVIEGVDVRHEVRV